MDRKKTTRWAKALYCIEYKGRYCNICGLDGFDNPWIMEYHHRDPSTKSFTVGNKTTSNRFENIRNELDKCDLLCCHCHRSLHAEENLKEFSSMKDKIFESLELLRQNNGNAEKIGLSEKFSKLEIESLINDGKTIKGISKIIGESYRSTQALLHKYGLETLAEKRPRLSENDSILRDYIKFKHSIKTLCSKYSKTEEEIKKLLECGGATMRNSLPGIDYDKVKELLESGVPKSKIWKIIGCGEYSIYRFCKRHNLS